MDTTLLDEYEETFLDRAESGGPAQFDTVSRPAMIAVVAGLTRCREGALAKASSTASIRSSRASKLSCT